MEKWVDVTEQITKDLFTLDDLGESPYRVRKVKLHVAEPYTLSTREQWAFIVEKKQP